MACPIPPPGGSRAGAQRDDHSCRIPTDGTPNNAASRSWGIQRPVDCAAAEDGALRRTRLLDPCRFRRRNRSWAKSATGSRTRSAPGTPAKAKRIAAHTVNRNRTPGAVGPTVCSRAKPRADANVSGSKKRSVHFRRTVKSVLQATSTSASPVPRTVCGTEQAIGGDASRADAKPRAG